MVRYTVLLSAALACLACNAKEQARAKTTSDSSVVTELSSDTLKVKPPAKTDTRLTQASAASTGMETLDAGPPPSVTKAETSTVTFRSNFRCGVRTTPVLTTLGVGNLQIGRTIAIVKQTCRVLRDIPEVNEGAPERVVTVLIGRDPIRVTVVNGLVWRLSLASPVFATRDGLRVGTSLAQLVRRGGVHLLEGEDGLYVTLDSKCGLSFRFSIPSRETPGKPWTVSHILQRHGSAVVDRILVTRCST